MVRLVFRPTLVDNAHDALASVRGRFLYEKKGKQDDWVDWGKIRLSSLKKGEGYELELGASELRNFFTHIAPLYKLRVVPTYSLRLYSAQAIPFSKSNRRKPVNTPKFLSATSLPRPAHFAR